MAIMETCPQCHKSIKSPHARLVRDECGHKKCRICLMKDEDGCQTCAAKKKSNGMKKHMNEKKMALQTARTKKHLKKLIICQPEDKQEPLRTKEKSDIKIVCHLKDSKEEALSAKTEESDDNLLDNQLVSESTVCAPTIVIETHDKLKIEINEADNDDKQSVSDNEEGIVEIKDDRKRKPLLIASHITITPGNPATYTCNICVKTFKRREHVRYHNFCATEEKPFKCEYCNQGFVTRGHYDCHILNHTGARPFVCETCNKGFIQKDKLTRHIRIHTGEKPYVCQTCGKSFSASHSLKGHYRTHTGEKPYLCTQCGRRFSESMNLRKHLIVHTGEKNFTCEDCGKRFGDKYSLNHHRRSHSRDRPFWCHKCYRGFITKKELKRHSIVHSDERPHSCSICDLSFRRKDNLERHMKNTHPETRMVNYGQFHKDSQQQQQTQQQDNAESTDNLKPPNSNSNSKRKQTIQQKSPYANIVDQNEGNMQSSQSQGTSCIKTVPRAHDKDKIKPYVELVVPPCLLKKLPEPTEDNIVKNISDKSKKIVNTTKNANKTNSMNSINVTSYREMSDLIHSSNITSLAPFHNLNVAGTMPWVQNLSAKGTIDPVQDVNAVRTINPDQNVSAIEKINSIEDLSASGPLNPVQDLSTTIQNLKDTRTLNSVQDLNISSYNSTNVISFKQMLVPVNSTSAFPGASLFQQIPDAVQQKSQAVPVINSPIAPPYSDIGYEENPRTSDTTSNYYNIIYNEDTGISSLPLSYSVISYDRDIETSNVPSNYPLISCIPRPTFGKEKIIIEGTNCVPTITKTSNVFPSNVSTSNIEQSITNVNTNYQRYFSCKKTGKVLETEIPFTPTRTLQSDLHWRKRTIELSQQEQEINDQIELDWKRY